MPPFGKASFRSGTIAGNFGNLVLAAAGAWTYTLDNANASVQALNAGQTLTDTVSVQSVEGTPQAIAITIYGVNEPITGSEGADHLTGTVGDDVIDAQAGNDTISAGDGNDRIIGGAGRQRQRRSGQRYPHRHHWRWQRRLCWRRRHAAVEGAHNVATLEAFKGELGRITLCRHRLSLQDQSK